MTTARPKAQTQAALVELLNLAHPRGIIVAFVPDHGGWTVVLHDPYTEPWELQPVHDLDTAANAALRPLRDLIAQIEEDERARLRPIRAFVTSEQIKAGAARIKAREDAKRAAREQVGE